MIFRRDYGKTTAAPQLQRIQVDNSSQLLEIPLGDGRTYPGPFQSNRKLERPTERGGRLIHHLKP